jgi:hypothetical protein
MKEAAETFAMASGLLNNLSLIFIVEIVLIIFLLLVIVLTMFQ